VAKQRQQQQQQQQCYRSSGMYWKIDKQCTAHSSSEGLGQVLVTADIQVQSAEPAPAEGMLAACSAQLQGVYLLAVGAGAVAKDVTMHAMGCAWEGH
jgi:hypothetical protein